MVNIATLCGSRTVPQLSLYQSKLSRSADRVIKLTLSSRWPTSVKIPADTAFPDWAFQNLTVRLLATTSNVALTSLSQAGTWNSTTSLAYKQTDSKEQTSATYPPSSSSGSGSNSSSGSDSNRHTTNVGAIAGGVVGGVVGLALIAGLAYWLWRRRRATKAKSLAPSAVYLASTPQPQDSSFRSPSVPISQRKFYVRT